MRHANAYTDCVTVGHGNTNGLAYTDTDSNTIGYADGDSEWYT
jgi:hypothetical protein